MGFFFISMERKTNYELAKRVSVPYGNLFYFYTNAVQVWEMAKLCFRPLWGSFLFLYFENDTYCIGGFGFPSPMGIFFISMKMRTLEKLGQ